MRKLFLLLFFPILIFSSCKHECDFELIDYIPATCTTKSLYVYQCRECNKENIQEGYNSTYSNCKFTLEYTKEPTCTEEGAKYYSCKQCGKNKEEVIEPTGHIANNNVCLKCSLKMKEYKIIYTSKMLSNGGVGSDWMTYITATDIDNKQVFIENNATYFAFPSTYVKAYCCACELDKSYSDSGGDWINIAFIDGYNTSTEFFVYEDRGQTARSKSKWQFSIFVCEI